MSRPAPRAFARPVSRMVLLVTLLALVIGPVSASPGGPGASGGGHELRPIGPAPIASGLLAKLQTGETDRFVVEFKAKPDLSKAKDIKGFKARGRFVMDALVSASAAQADALALVRSTRGARAESFWLRNTLIVSGDDKLAERLARLPGVAEVRAERVFPLIKPVETRAIEVLDAAPEWGVAKIGADAVWAEGILGSGIVIANVDTGVEYDHEALVNQYRGNTAAGFDHNYSWWDPTGICGDTPCDNAGHGTHTMGTMVGGDGPGPFTPDIGVAPGARWIAAKGCEDLFCSEGALLSAGQFILAPTDLNGENADPGKRPDIVNNSWGSGPGDPFYADVVSAWRASGIIPVFSAGNAGPQCGSAGSPGDFLESFSVGATDIDDVIADFSSRGPSVFGKISPDVSAPGVAVSSSVPGGGYAEFDGTSMAAPHVAGTLALMLSAEPSLIGQFDAATAALRDTALDILDDQCGGEEDGDPNNVYGDGRIDAQAAVALVATGGTLAGTVTDADTADPIGGATVSATNELRTFRTTTAADGTFELFLGAGSYAVTAEAFGYAMSLAEGVTIETDVTTTQDFALVALPRHDVTGVVTAASDGAPIENATVTAIGTPVPPAVTNSNGVYTLTLPEGSYSLRTSAGGCTDFGFAEVDVFADVTADFVIARKLDAFGHGCAPIGFDWVDATTQTALYGEDFVGRLRLPFEFSFYGEAYSQVFISDNGYLNFLTPDQFNPFPVVIPNDDPPNAAIYALWQDMRIDEVGAIEYTTVGTEPNRAFVIEYSEVKAGSSQRAFEIKLWENGDIDLVYDHAGTGANAGIGIENADGTDAFQFSYLTDILANDSAYRITEVPTGLVTGTVTDANDGLPIEGATIEAIGSGRLTETDENGAYQLRLLPGSYTLSISSPGYTTHEEPFGLSVDEELVIDAALGAPIGSVEPTELSASVPLGSSTDLTVTLTNTGSGPLEWTARERATGHQPPELPAIEGAPKRFPTWARGTRPAGVPLAETSAIPSDQLSEVISDPEGDASGVDLVSVRAGSDSAEMTMELVYATGADEGVGFVFLDVDQDPSTGLPAEAFNGLPSQDIGMEYFVDLFFTHDPDPIVFIVDAITFDVVAETTARVDGDTIAFDVPLDAIGGDDGFINTALVTGDFFQPTDWAPDEGHGVIEPFTDAPWVSESPDSGVIPAGESAEVTVTLGGPDVEAGTYEGRLVFVTNDPKSGALTVDLNLEVTLPETFGAASGTISEVHSGEPLPATVLIEAEHEGSPHPVEVTAAADGTWTAIGPEGTWPATISLDGYLPESGTVTIVAGGTSGGQDFALHREQPHATLDGGPFTFVLPEGRTADGTLVLANTEGHLPLEFTVGEIDLTPPPSEPAPEGEGEFVERADATTAGRANLEGSVARPSMFRWTPDAETSDLSVLVYADDPVHPAPDTLVDQALQRLGIAYTAHYDADFGGFESSLESGTWDLVIFANDNWGPDSSTLDALLAYVEGGGKLIAHSWVMGELADHPLWAAMGASHVSDDIEPPDPVFWWQPSHPAFLLPQSVPELTELDAIGFLVYGQHVDASSGQAIAGYTSPGPDDGEGAMVIGPERTTVFRGFIDAHNSADRDEDGLLDGSELWENLVTGIQFGFLSDAPWLSVEPESGTVDPDESADLTVTVDSTGLEVGVYEAMAVVQTNDPDNAAMQVPVTLIVSAYQQGVDAGGSGHETADGVVYASDQAYVAGSFGYAGGQKRSTRGAIAGTDEDGLYRTLRIDMTAYRFDVPVEGTYRVDLHFADFIANKAGARIFSVRIEGTTVLSGLDLVGEAGTSTAFDRTFDAAVSDGRLDIEFVAQRGDKPILNGVLVTHRPDLAAD